MAEHLYMFAGESIRVKFRAKTYLVDQIIDWYGKDINILQTGEDECITEVMVNKEAFFYWALQYGPHIELLEPLDMRERIAEAVKKMCEKYN